MHQQIEVWYHGSPKWQEILENGIDFDAPRRSDPGDFGWGFYLTKRYSRAKVNGRVLQFVIDTTQLAYIANPYEAKKDTLEERLFENLAFMYHDWDGDPYPGGIMLTLQGGIEKRIQTAKKIRKEFLSRGYQGILTDYEGGELVLFSDKPILEIKVADEKNPLEPRTPDAPPWDPSATAKGVYITDDIEIAKSYAAAVVNNDNSVPLVVEIDISNISFEIDPQAIDLLQEPYMYFRRDILNQALEAYNQAIFDVSYELEAMSSEDRKMMLKKIRTKQGPVYDYVVKFITDPKQMFGAARPEYNTPTIEKIEAAKYIFPSYHSWALINSMHDFYGDLEAPEKILEYMQLFRDDEESPYNPNSVFVRVSTPIKFSPDFWFYLSNFAYLKNAVPDEDILRIWKLDETTNNLTLVYQKTDQPQVTHRAFHGSSSKRLMEAIPGLLSDLD